MKASLVLEDGAVFEGSAFGAPGRAAGVAVFYTGVVGYQEVLTAPSYRGMLTAFTYPIIGSYGVNAEDSSSERAEAAGVIVRDYSARHSNFRATGSLEDFLCESGVVGVRGVDTRALAVHLREKGEMKGAIIPGDFDRAEAAAEVKRAACPLDGDLAGAPTASILSGGAGPGIGLIDAGATRGLMALLRDLGLCREARVEGVEPLIAARPAGVIVAGGAGDPRRASGAAAAVKAVLGRVPVLGIGLGHQLVALALGCSVSRMRTGHHGINHSVRDLATGRCAVTSQHHSFVVDAACPAGVEVTHVNVNDGTVEGVAGRANRASGVQFYPGRDDMGAPETLLRQFVEGAHA